LWGQLPLRSACKGAANFISRLLQCLEFEFAVFLFLEQKKGLMRRMAMKLLVSEVSSPLKLQLVYF
jgi:hypothetical protein